MPSEENTKRRKIPNQRKGESKKEEFPIKRGRESKKGRKEKSQSRIERKQKKYAERSLDQTISEQYRIVTKKKKEANHDLK